MGKLVEISNTLISTIKNEASIAVGYISDFNKNYGKYEILGEAHDIVYLKTLMKEKLLLGLNNNDVPGSDTTSGVDIEEAIEK